MTKPLASLSLDLDNKWSYLKTHGDAGWEEFPSYLDVAVPRVLDLLRQRGLRITFFIVGQDAVLDKNRDALRMIADAGHEIGNHSFHHEPWLHLYSREEIAAELENAETAIDAATGQRPIGFRGPGYSFSRPLHEELAERGYQYDASTLPSFIGPLARAYFFMTSRLSKEEREERKKLFGSWREGFRSLRPHLIEGLSCPVVEAPVTTMPILRLPFHLSYLQYLASYSMTLAKAYFRVAIGLCRLLRVEPSYLLHPTDFLGRDDEPSLSFFPGMRLESKRKLELAGWVLDALREHFEVVTMHRHVLHFQGVATPSVVREASV